jgi:hypothetical protein
VAEQYDLLVDPGRRGRSHSVGLVVVVMDVLQKSNGKWVIIHAAREVAKDFDTEADAWSWADEYVDDQVTCTPNWLAEPLEYRSPKPDLSRHQ